MQDPVDKRQEHVIELCERAVERLADALPDVEVGGLLRVGDSLRHVAHAGRRRVIYEVPREQGGVVWRAVRNGETQLVDDVRGDPDYLTSDAEVRSEIAAPVWLDEEVALVLDIEFPGRVYAPDEAERVQREAARLERELAGEPYPS